MKEVRPPEIGTVFPLRVAYLEAQQRMLADTVDFIDDPVAPEEIAAEELNDDVEMAENTDDDDDGGLLVAANWFASRVLLGSTSRTSGHDQRRGSRRSTTTSKSSSTRSTRSVQDRHHSPSSTPTSLPAQWARLDVWAPPSGTCGIRRQERLRSYPRGAGSRGLRRCSCSPRGGVV